MAHIRTKAELDALDLTPAEEKLIVACKIGEFCKLGDGTLPAKGIPDPEHHIRANVLRYLILGGCPDCKTDDIGVWVKGAHVTGSLDLDFTTARGAIRLLNSRFEQRLDMEQAKCKVLSLNGGDLNGLRGQALYVEGSVFLSNITTHATINLHSTTIDGQLEFENAAFEINAGIGLNAQSAKIKGGLIWREVSVSKCDLIFVGAHITTLSDDESWPSGGQIDFDGMTYDKIAGGATDAKTRLAWLEKGTEWNGEFTPQPYTQLAKVLRDMGHDSDARTILLERDRLLAPQNRADLKVTPDGTWPVWRNNLWYTLTNPIRIFVDFMFRLIAGYGHRPFRSIPILLALIGIAIVPAHFAWTEGSFAPNSAVILNSDDWKTIEQSEERPSHVWSGDTPPIDWVPPTENAQWKHHAPGQDWETFNRYAYGLDIVIPIINFGQTEAWAPSTNRGWWGKQLYWLRWVLGALGWIVTALGAAAITGVIRRD